MEKSQGSFVLDGLNPITIHPNCPITETWCLRGQISWKLSLLTSPPTLLYPWGEPKPERKLTASLGLAKTATQLLIRVGPTTLLCRLHGRFQSSRQCFGWGAEVGCIHFYCWDRNVLTRASWVGGIVVAHNSRLHSREVTGSGAGENWLLTSRPGWSRAASWDSSMHAVLSSLPPLLNSRPRECCHPL